MLTLVGMQGVGTSSCYDRKVRSEIHSPAAYHHKSTDCLIKITVHLQLLTTPHQIRAVRSFGEYRPGENEIDVSARQRSQQLWRENPQFRAILAVNFESENDSNKLSGGGDGPDIQPSPLRKALKNIAEHWFRLDDRSNHDWLPTPKKSPSQTPCKVSHSIRFLLEDLTARTRLAGAGQRPLDWQKEMVGHRHGLIIRY